MNRASKESGEDQMIGRAYRAWEARGEKPIRFFPVDFLTEEHVEHYAVPYPPAPRWPSLARILGLYDSQNGIMLMAPLHWQLISTLATIREPFQIPISFMHGSNIPVAVEIMKQTEMRGAIVEVSLVEPFMAAIDEAGVELDWLLSITSLPAYRTRTLPIVRGPLLFDEIHLSPGCALLSQTVAQSGSSLYERSPDFLWEEDSGIARITAESPHVLPVLRLALPFNVKGEEGAFSLTPL